MGVIAIVIPVDGPLERVEIDRDENLDELQRLVGGGWVQCVPAPPEAGGERLAIYVNEEGKFRDDLKPNPRGTAFMGAGGLLPGDCITGPMVLTGATPSGGTGVLPQAAVSRADQIEREAAV